MPLFQRKRFVWNEPWFFQQRIRTKMAWVMFALILLVFVGLVGVALYFSRPAGARMNPWEIVGLCIGLAAAVWWVLDGTNTRRQAVLFEDSIVVGGDMGKYSVPETYKLSEIPAMAIVLPEESKWPATALFFLFQGEEQAIGIDSKTSLKRLAQAIHDVGGFIRLDGWQPSQESEFEKAFSWQADPRNVVEKAALEILPPGTPSIMSVGGILIALVRQCWAIALWLAITAAAIYYGYLNWQTLDLVRMSLLILIPIGVLYLAGQYTERIASAATTRGLTHMAMKQFRKREGLQINPEVSEVIPVEVFQRDQFANTIQRMHEVGFLQPDERGGRMLFEGKKQRWCIPAGSIHSFAIEDVQVGAPGASGALIYYVVVRFAADEVQELGFRNGDRDFGDFNDVKRAEGAIRVFEAFESILPLG